MNRRDFLKLSSISLIGQLVPRLIRENKQLLRSTSKPNILLIVLDAWSAKNVTLYGYPRETTPHINKLAENAIVYHNHYASGSFTAPGTGSILTGLYPWRHQVLRCGDRLNISDSVKSIFSLLDQSYYQIAYTHNPCADFIFQNEIQKISQYIERREFYIDKDILFDKWLSNDYEFANIARQLSLLRHMQGLQSSLFFQWIYSISQYFGYGDLTDLYPRGLPQMGDSAQRFLLEDSINWITSDMNNWSEPFFGYFHFLPPHAPYNTRYDFIDNFKDDGYSPLEKPMHPLSPGISREQRVMERQEYDEFIQLADAEFARLYGSLDQKGLLNNTWIILTSDHGETFERGEYHHTTKLLFNPVIHVPLLIFPPKLQKRIDIVTPTNSVDLVPTILKLVDNEIPNWMEGTPLPLEETTQTNQKPIFSMNFESNKPNSSFTNGTIMMIIDNFKIMKLMGYAELENEGPLVEVYDLANDPEELNNLALSRNPIVGELEDMLDQYLTQENEKFR